MSVINTNIQALATARSLNVSQDMLGRSLTRLSSGSKIVNPSDDAAGVAVSEKLDAQNRRVQAASTNVQNAISFIQSSDGFMSSMTKVLSRMSELAILSKDASKNPEDVALYQQEFTALQDQLRDTIGGTSAQIGGNDVNQPLGSFNGVTLFGSDANPLTVTIGRSNEQTMTVNQVDLRKDSMLSLIQQDSSGNYLVNLGDANVVGTLTSTLQQVATGRSDLGASQSRLELASASLSVEQENLASAISRIRDVDVAHESTQYARYNILVQSGTAMLSQANQAPQSVLKLLQS
jgi:flagellin